MPPLVDIKFDKNKLKKIERMFKDTPKAMPKIMSQSINKVTVSARADSARRISGEVKVKVTTVKKSMTTVKATFTRLLSTITISARRIPLIEFGAKPTTKRGVTFRIKKTGKRQRAPRAFIRTMSSGHRGVFKRKSRTKGSDKLVARSPIVELRGPSLKRVFVNSAEIVAQVLTKAAAGLEKEIDRRVKLILEKR